MAKDTLPLCVDYKSFANDDNGLLPYLAECAKKLTMREADDELDQLIDDIETVSEALDNLAQEIVQMREEYDELKERRDTIRSVIAKQREAEREIKNQMFDFFGEVPDDQQDDDSEDDADVSLEDLMQEADLISKNNLDVIPDDTNSEEILERQQPVDNVPRRSHAATVAGQQPAVASLEPFPDISGQASDPVTEHDELTQQMPLENNDIQSVPEENDDLFSELDALDISESLPDPDRINLPDSDDEIDLSRAGLILDDDIDNLSDDPNEMLAEEYGGLIDPVEIDTDDGYKPLSEIDKDENEKINDLNGDDLFGDDIDNQPIVNNDTTTYDSDNDDDNNDLFGDDDEDPYDSFIDDDLLNEYESMNNVSEQPEIQEDNDDFAYSADDFDDIDDLPTIDDDMRQEASQPTTPPQRQSRASRNARGTGAPQFIDPNIFSI